ncbi:hypothetical protein [Thalassoglobus sp.]|uniref:hypothetical protein n=1 Tax=Thalassoglobus sp. TaxID=2795869 RepID=UPI003AA7FAA4
MFHQRLHTEPIDGSITLDNADVPNADSFHNLTGTLVNELASVPVSFSITNDGGPHHEPLQP